MSTHKQSFVKAFFPVTCMKHVKLAIKYVHDYRLHISWLHACSALGCFYLTPKLPIKLSQQNGRAELLAVFKINDKSLNMAAGWLHIVAVQAHFPATFIFMFNLSSLISKSLVDLSSAKLQTSVTGIIFWVIELTYLKSKPTATVPGK